jgi:hypothetical protein
MALLAARTALPVVCGERQNVMAVGVLTADRVLAAIDGRPLDRLEDESLEALDVAPQAARWAYGFTQRSTVSVERFRRYGAPDTIRCAVQGVADAAISDPDGLLREMLADAIDICRTSQTAAMTAYVDDAAWVAACQLTRER